MGTTATDVGDFTTLLLDINPTYTVGGYPEVWTQQTVTVTGVPAATLGRLAFRYFVENGGPTGANSNYIGIDDFQFNGACGGGGTPTPTATPTATPINLGFTTPTITRLGYSVSCYCNGSNGFDEPSSATATGLARHQHRELSAHKPSTSRRACASRPATGLASAASSSREARRLCSSGPLDLR